ncbi:hypothetical protein O8C83_04715 [Aliarcobacter butzleri]|uniref:hypothetical protein n=1 Tax=Aliarcobacter butzleri TaxID=28197 RepID=UPI00263D694C|nr:hypothetical protein [Aliarcobacter butzleri]MDN5100113.1 hypothetical protein [Aliarcobacter butzleri]
MDINKIILLFGKEYRDKELVEFFQKDELDIVKEIKEYMQTDYYQDAESSVYVENPLVGYSLVFEDELDFFSIEDGIYGESGNYYFICIHIHTQGYEGYEQYQGVLINGIKMTDTVEEIRNKLGDNYKRHDFLDVDIWENINGVKIFIDYKKKNTPQIISISLVR